MTGDGDAQRDAPGGRPDVAAQDFPWLAIHGFSPLVAQWRELSELSYLWRVPHRIDGTRCSGAIGAYPDTPFPQAVTGPRSTPSSGNVTRGTPGNEMLTPCRTKWIMAFGDD